MPPSAAAAVAAASRNTHAFTLKSKSKSKSVAYSLRSATKMGLGLTTRVHTFFQSSPSESSSSAASASTTSSTNTASTTMVNVEVRQHQRHNQATTSALQAPLPRHIPHYSTLRRPIPNSYWATPYLLACEYPWAPSTPRPKLDALLAAGVRTFIDLTESGELLGYSQLLPLRAHSCGLPASESNTIKYFRFPIPDRSLPSSPAFLSRILSVLARCEAQRRVAAVHCRGGIGRTGTVVGCWLVQSGRCRDGEEALTVIRREWETVEKHTRFPCSPETGAQAEFVRRFRRLDLEGGGGVQMGAGVGASAAPALARTASSGSTSVSATTTATTTKTVSAATKTKTTTTRAAATASETVVSASASPTSTASVAGEKRDG